MRVLFADDSNLILKRLREKFFEIENIEVVASLRYGMQGLENNAVNQYLAGVDIRMPDLNGLKVLNQVRKEDKTIKSSNSHFIHPIITGVWLIKPAPIFSLIKWMILIKSLSYCGDDNGKMRAYKSRL